MQETTKAHVETSTRTGKEGEEHGSEILEAAVASQAIHHRPGVFDPVSAKLADRKGGKSLMCSRSAAEQPLLWPLL
jgi:hypothetical protein